MDIFDSQFLPALKGREGGGTFTNRPADRGGPTRWGITAKTLGAFRKLGRPATAAEVQALQESEADAIYRSEFFISPGFNQVAAISPRIAEELIDTGVNMGPSQAVLMLQHSLNLCNRRGKDWSDLPLTGNIGPLTLAALRSELARRGQSVGEDLMLRCLNGLQFMRYVTITERGGPNSDQEENFCGWVLGRIGAI